jgi:hypothetical protein
LGGQSATEFFRRRSIIFIARSQVAMSAGIAPRKKLESFFDKQGFRYCPKE